MKGKVAATVGAGAAVDIAMRAMLKKAGLEDKRDYTVVEAAFPNMRALLADKKADLDQRRAAVRARSASLLEVGKTLFTVKDAIGRSQFIVWVAREGFLQKNKAAMTDFMEDFDQFAAFPDGPEEPRHADGNRGTRGQAPRLGLFGVDVHQQGSLSRSRT